MKQQPLCRMAYRLKTLNKVGIRIKVREAHTWRSHFSRKDTSKNSICRDEVPGAGAQLPQCTPCYVRIASSPQRRNSPEK